MFVGANLKHILSKVRKCKVWHSSSVASDISTALAKKELPTDADVERITGWIRYHTNVENE